jgi:5-methylcytosine-specific restriction endonuclease McrA
MFIPDKLGLPTFDEMIGNKKPSTGRTSCPKSVKEKVWREYNGNRMNGECYACETKISYTNFEVGHNKARSKGGKWTVANCRPICRSCNRSMGTMTIEAFKKKYFTKKKTPKKPIKKKPMKRKQKDPYDLSQYMPKL